MAEYTIITFATASHVEVVEADSYDEALTKAYMEGGTTTLCWECSGKVELGDFEEGDYYYLDGEEVRV